MKTIIYLALAIGLPFMAKAQLQNTGFEQWERTPEPDQIQSNRPVGWTIDTGHGLVGSNANYGPVIEDAQSGDYSLMLGIWYTHVKDMAVQTAPIASRPVALKGQYKYTEAFLDSEFGNGYDQASATVILTKWNEAASRQDTIGSGHIFLSGAIWYTEFVCPITYTSHEIPDSVTVILDPSLMNHEGWPRLFSPSGESSFLTIDSIELVEEDSSGRLGISTVQQKKFGLYPNPVNNVLKFTDFKGDVEVYDTTGKLVISQKQKESISVQNLQPGLYHVKLNDGTTVQSSKFIKQ